MEKLIKKLQNLRENFDTKIINTGVAKSQATTFTKIETQNQGVLLRKNHCKKKLNYTYCLQTTCLLN